MASKNNALSKTIEIDSIEYLLELIDSKSVADSYPGFRVYVSNALGKSPEIISEVGTEKICLKIRPILHPNRRLLEEEPVSDALLLCPHIAEPLASDLRKAGRPHADLNGRLFFRTPSGLVDIRQQESKYRNPSTGPDPFSPKATRILRHLLCRRQAEVTQAELEKKTGASRALVSQVLSRLEENGWVEQLSSSSRGRPGLYRLADFDGLLDAWANRDEWRKRVTIHQYSVLSNTPDGIARKLVEAVGSESIAFSQWFAAWLRRPHTIPPLVSAYVKKRHILDIAPARQVSSGGNLWLLVPEDEGVWQQGRETEGFPLVSDVQIYLDLLQVGQRGPETAAELRAWDGFAR